MNYKDIINDIKNRNIKNTYLFYGKEYYLIENAIKVIKSTLNDGMIDFNLDNIAESSSYFNINPADSPRAFFVEIDRAFLSPDTKRRPQVRTP